MTSKGLWGLYDLGLEVKIALVGNERGAGFTATHELAGHRQVELTLLDPQGGEHDSGLVVA